MNRLEHFFFGHQVQDGQPQGDPIVLAKSRSVTDAQIQAALERAAVPTLPASNRVTWGIMRIGRGQPQVLTRVELGDAGQLMRHIILLPSETIRSLAGNLSALLPLLPPHLPTFEKAGAPLKPMPFEINAAPDAEQQVDKLLNLMTYTKNQIRNIEPLLAAVVSGVPLVLLNAPQELETRLNFVEAMLMLLPASTRHGVSFLLHNDNLSDLRVQISFQNEAPLDKDLTIYDWETAQISGEQLKTDYSRFITGQLRLDAELVTRETEKLTRTAGWRFQNGDSLNDALGYASHRARMDQTIETGLPVEIDQVAKVLKEDPTLTDQQREMYARHLMNFSLALEDMSSISPVSPIMQRNTDFADEMYEMLAQAAQDGKGALVFDTLASWMNDPLSPQGPRWTGLMQKAAMAELKELIADQDTEGLTDYLDQIRNLEAVVGPIVPTLVNETLLLLERDTQLAQRVLLLAIQHIPMERLRKLLLLRQFNAAQPPAIRTLLKLLLSEEQRPPRNAIMDAVRAFDASLRVSALLTFVKLAHALDRHRFLNRQVLERVVKMMTEANLHDDDLSLLAEIGKAFSDQYLERLKEPMPRLILQMQLLGHRYDLLSESLIRQSRDYYKAAGQLRYVLSVQQMFAKTSLTPRRAREALQAMQANGIINVPLFAGMAGTLESTNGVAEMKPTAEKLIEELQEQPHFIDVLPPQSFMTLMQFLSRYPDMGLQLKLTIHMAAQCSAAQEDSLGLKAISSAYKLLDGRAQTKPLALELLRQYVRVANDEAARRLVTRYGEELGDTVREKLQTSYEFSNMLGRTDLLTYAMTLERTIALLQSTAETFAAPHAVPELMHFRRMAERFRDGTSTGDLYELSRELRRMAHTVVILSEQHSRRGKNSERYMQQIVDGSQEPQSMVDVFRAAGATLNAKKLYPFRLSDQGNEQPFGDESAIGRIGTVAAASNLLHQATTARPTNRQMWSQALIADELRSQSLTYGGSADQQALRQLGRNWQRLADLILHISEYSDTKVIEAENRRGQRLDRHEAQPADPLQLYRFVYGYFAP